MNIDPSVIDGPLVITCAGLSVAGLSALLGIWVERDKQRPPRYAIALSLLVILATFVSLAEAYVGAERDAAMAEDMARILENLDELAHGQSDAPLDGILEEIIQDQQRNNPQVVERLALRLNNNGKNAEKVIGRYLEQNELQRVRNLNTKPEKPKLQGQPRPK